MSKRVIKKSALVLLGMIAVLYLVLLITNMGADAPMTVNDLNTNGHRTVAVFGATGTIGDGLLKAAMADPDVNKIHVVTRRPSPRIESGVAIGKVMMTTHQDYQDYAAISEILSEVDAVYWAIGLSAVGLDEATYREIHATYPLKLISDWLNASERERISFHYVSGSGANADSRMMWAREKARAEAELADLAKNTKLRVISYRPAFILPTETESNIGHRILHAIFAPIGRSVRSESIGQAMLEVSAHNGQFDNGMILENAEILMLGKAYEQRRGNGHRAD